jgi:hypothetical protein
MPYPKNAVLHSWWQESQRDFADITRRRASAPFIDPPATQLTPATRQRVPQKNHFFHIIAQL